MRRTRLLNKLHKRPNPPKPVPKQTKKKYDLENSYALMLLQNKGLLIIAATKLLDAMESHEAHKINDDELKDAVDAVNDIIRQFEISTRDGIQDIISKFENDDESDKELISHLRDYISTFNERVKKREEQD